MPSNHYAKKSLWWTPSPQAGKTVRKAVAVNSQSATINKMAMDNLVKTYKKAKPTEATNAKPTKAKDKTTIDNKAKPTKDKKAKPTIEGKKAKPTIKGKK